MSIRAQREQIRKLNIKDRKLGRLFSFEEVEEADAYFLNYLYEEKQHLAFWSLGVSLVGGFLSNFIFFRKNSFAYQTLFISATTGLTHMMFQRKINNRFEGRITPYFEKYEIK